jgi:pentatricopeptide repeat protein
MKYENGVQQIWEEMEMNGSGPDQRSFTIMVHGLDSHGKLDQALQYYTTMKSRGMTPEPRTRILVKVLVLGLIRDKSHLLRGQVNLSI